MWGFCKFIVWQFPRGRIILLGFKLCSFTEDVFAQNKCCITQTVLRLLYELFSKIKSQYMYVYTPIFAASVYKYLHCNEFTNELHLTLTSNNLVAYNDCLLTSPRGDNFCLHKGWAELSSSASLSVPFPSSFPCFILFHFNCCEVRLGFNFYLRYYPGIWGHQLQWLQPLYSTRLYACIAAYLEYFTVMGYDWWGLNVCRFFFLWVIYLHSPGSAQQPLIECSCFFFY